jgi:hypothetical protein
MSLRTLGLPTLSKSAQAQNFTLAKADALILLWLCIVLKEKGQRRLISQGRLARQQANIGMHWYGCEPANRNRNVAFRQNEP